MTFVKSFGVGIGLLAWGLAGPVLAQRSLFDAPPAGGAAPPPAAAAPSAPAAEPAAEPRRKKPRRKKPRGPVPARSLTVQNASPNTLTALEVSGDGKTARLSKPLAAKGKTTLKLPALKTCSVSVSATFEGSAQAEASEFDICKDKVIRFTE